MRNNDPLCSRREPHSLQSGTRAVPVLAEGPFLCLILLVAGDDPIDSGWAEIEFGKGGESAEDVGER